MASTASTSECDPAKDRDVIEQTQGTVAKGTMRSSRHDCHSSRHSIRDDVDETADAGSEIKKPEAIEVFACPQHDLCGHGEFEVPGMNSPFCSSYLVSDFQGWP
jgi:hypothetical protein